MDNDAVATLTLILLFGAAIFTVLAGLVFIPWLGVGLGILATLVALAASVGLVIDTVRSLMGGGGE